MVIDRGELDENQRIERDERIVELLADVASALEAWGARGELETRVRNMAFEVHAGLDPHCTCNDCIAEFAGGEEELGDGLPSAEEIRAAGISDDEGETCWCGCGSLQHHQEAVEDVSERAEANESRWRR